MPKTFIRKTTLKKMIEKSGWAEFEKAGIVIGLDQKPLRFNDADYAKSLWGNQCKKLKKK